MKLAETQALFWSLLTDRRPPDGAPKDALERCFRPSPTLAAAERVNIYADMVLWRQVDALREDYPAVVALLGDHEFYHLAETYIARHPSRSPSLSRLGRELPAFLAAEGEQPAHVAELAALEWARAEVFEEAEVTALEPIAFGELAADAARLPSLVLRLSPALRRLRLRHDLLPLWTALDEKLDERPEVAATPTAVAVWRKEFDLYQIGLPDDEAAALDAVAAGASLGQVCEAFADHETPVEAAFAAIGSWLVEGWIVAAD